MQDDDHAPETPLTLLAYELDSIFLFAGFFGAADASAYPVPDCLQYFAHHGF